MAKKEYLEMRNRFTHLGGNKFRVTLLIIPAAEVCGESVTEAREVLGEKLHHLLASINIGEIKDPGVLPEFGSKSMGDMVREFGRIDSDKSAGSLIAYDYGLIRDGSNNFCVTGTVSLSEDAIKLVTAKEPYRFQIRGTKTKSDCPNKPDLLDKIIGFDLVKYYE